jgi:hypothetical protein
LAAAGDEYPDIGQLELHEQRTTQLERAILSRIVVAVILLVLERGGTHPYLFSWKMFYGRIFKITVLPVNLQISLAWRSF